MGNHALVLGASGIQGWAIVNEILDNYPSKDAFEKVTALSNRPVPDNILWPQSGKLQVVSGIDLLTENGQEGVEKDMKEKISGIESVTHIFFCAYIFKLDPDEEVTTNVKLLQNAIGAVQSLAKDLKFILLPTGTKAYGVHLADGFPFRDRLPLSEDLPRLEEPFASQNFYYHMCDWLEKESKGKDWTWCEIRPDIVVGFIPNNNFYGITQILATYLALYKEIHGEGAECAFPGNDSTWSNQVSNDSSQDIIARFAIHCALNPKICGQGQAFNIADNSKPSTWKQKWPVLCEYFRLKGTAPPPGGKGPDLPQFFKDHLNEYKQMEKKYHLASGRVGNERTLVEISQMLLLYLDYDRRLDLSKCHRAWNSGGNAQEVNSYTAWWTAFQRFRQAAIIP